MVGFISDSCQVMGSCSCLVHSLQSSIFTSWPDSPSPLLTDTILILQFARDYHSFSSKGDAMSPIFQLALKSLCFETKLILSCHALFRSGQDS